MQVKKYFRKYKEVVIEFEVSGERRRLTCDSEVDRPPIESLWPYPGFLLLRLHSYLNFVSGPNPEEAVTLDVDRSEVVAVCPPSPPRLHATCGFDDMQVNE
ncbi:hypothetical protein QE152_g5698 [Popillia japonica]|uniref:Uncharacterized protein n=1 Tax=Popillia japonica TaxID=7064 RepID=A0AAW1MLJ2_POPJA